MENVCAVAGLWRGKEAVSLGPSLLLRPCSGLLRLQGSYQRSPSLTGVRWDVRVILIWISLKANDIEFFFMCLLVICASFEKCLFSSFVIYWLDCLFFWCLSFFEFFIDADCKFSGQRFSPIYSTVFVLVRRIFLDTFHLCFEARSHCVAWAGFKFKILFF